MWRAEQKADVWGMCAEQFLIPTEQWGAVFSPQSKTCRADRCPSHCPAKPRPQLECT